MDKNVCYHGDCLEVMARIPDKSIDMILADLPYGITACKWDTIIPFDSLWEQYKRVIKDNGAIVLTAAQPFTSALVMSNVKMFKYSWVWQKDNGTNFLNSKFQPLKITEDICVFGNGATSFTKNGITMKYNPQFTEGRPYSIKSGNQKDNSAVVRGGKCGRETNGGFETVSDGKRYPKNLIQFTRDKEKLHPTQKPVLLFEYLIKTYSNEGDIILDNVCGSGTTGVACKNTNRDFILIEKDEMYCKMACERVGCKIIK